MDEPCSALDPIATARIEDLMQELKTEYTIVIVTHNMQQAARVSDRTAFFTTEVNRDERPPHRRARRVRRAPRRSSPTRPTSGRRTTSPAGSADRRSLTATDCARLPPGARRDPRRASTRLAASVDRGHPPRHRRSCSTATSRAPTTSSRPTTRSTSASLELEERCYQVLALQQPVASDLRALIAAVEDDREIERSGDLCVNICKAARRIYGHELDPRLRGLIARMSEQAQPAVPLAIDAYVEGDASLAAALDDMDDCLDRLHKRVHPGHLREPPRRTASTCRSRCSWPSSARFYERIGDHAVNIGERVRYMVTGWLPEHDRRGPAHGRHERSTPTDAAEATASAEWSPCRRGRRRPASATARAGGAVALVLAPCAGCAGWSRSSADRRARPAERRRRRSTSSSGRAAPRRGAGARRRRPSLERLRPALDAIPRAWSSPTPTGAVVLRNARGRALRSAPATATRSSRRPSTRTLRRGAARASAGASTLELFGPPRRTRRRRAPCRSTDGGALRRRSRTSPSAPARGHAHRLRGQHQPRAEDAGRRARRCWPRRSSTRTTPRSSRRLAERMVDEAHPRRPHHRGPARAVAASSSGRRPHREPVPVGLRGRRGRRAGPARWPSSAGITIDVRRAVPPARRRRRPPPARVGARQPARQRA